MALIPVFCEDCGARLGRRIHDGPETDEIVDEFMELCGDCKHAREDEPTGPGIEIEGVVSMPDFLRNLGLGVAGGPKPGPTADRGAGTREERE